MYGIYFKTYIIITINFTNERNDIVQNDTIYFYTIMLSIRICRGVNDLAPLTKLKLRSNVPSGLYI